MRLNNTLGLLLISWMTLACSSGTKAHLGEECNATSDCIEGYCGNAGVCKKDCERHSECGCPSGTNNGDIANGACDLACFESVCAKVCDSGLECGGETRCAEGTLFNACL